MAAQDPVWEVRVDYEDGFSRTVVLHAADQTKALKYALRSRLVKLPSGFIYIQPCGVRIIRQRIEETQS